MTNILLAFAIIVLMIVFDGIKMWQEKLKKDIWVCAALLLIGVTLSFLYDLNVAIPSPLEAIKFVFKPISEWFFQWLS